MEGSFTEGAVVVGIVNFKWCMVYGGHMKLAEQALTSLTAETPQKVVLREILPSHNWRLNFRLSETNFSSSYFTAYKKSNFLKVHDFIMKTVIIKIIAQWP